VIATSTDCLSADLKGLTPESSPNHHPIIMFPERPYCMMMIVKIKSYISLTSVALGLLNSAAVNPHLADNRSVLNPLLIDSPSTTHAGRDHGHRTLPRTISPEQLDAGSVMTD